MDIRRYWDDVTSHLRTASDSGRPVLLLGGALCGKSAMANYLVRADPQRVHLVPPDEVARRSFEAGSLVIVELESADDLDEARVRSLLDLPLNEQNRLILTARPQAASRLRQFGLTVRAATFGIRRVGLTEIDGLDPEAVTRLLDLTGANPRVIDLICSAGGGRSLDDAIEMVRPALHDAYYYIYSQLPEDHRRLLSLVVSSGEFSATQCAASGFPISLCEDLCYWLLLQRKESPPVTSYTVSSGGFLNWLRDYIYVPTAASSRAIRARMKDSNTGPPIIEDQVVSLLHVSDTQFGSKHIFENREITLTRLYEDLKRLNLSGIRTPDVILVSGDIAESGMPEEYGDAFWFREKLAEGLALSSRSRIIIVPGNHDVCWPLSRASSEKRSLRPFRLAPFHAFLERWYDSEVLDVLRHRRFLSAIFPEFDLAVTGFNTCEREDHETHGGWLDESLVEAAAEYSRQTNSAAARCLVSVMHHGALEHQPDQDVLVNAASVRRALELHGYSMCFHGHVHESGATSANRLWLLAAGSAGVVATERPGDARLGSVRNQYQVVCLGPQAESGRQGIVYSRVYDPFAQGRTGRGRWIAGVFDDLEVDRWWHQIDLKVES